MAKKMNYGWYVVAALFATVTAGVLSSCSADDTSYQDIVDKTPDNNDNSDHKGDPKDTVVVDSAAWASVLGSSIKNVNGTIYSTIWGKTNAGDSIKAELIYPLDAKLSAPSRVYGKKDSTIYYMQTQEVYDSWTYVYSGCDSIESTRVSRDFVLRENNAGELYRISLSYTLQRGYILVKGSRYEFPMPSITSGYIGHSRQWENIELDDSTFLREVLTSQIKFNAQFVESALTSTTNVDRNGTPKATDTTTDDPTADFYVKGLNSFLGGNKFFNKPCNCWSDGLLFEGDDNYLIVYRNFTVNGDGKESYASGLQSKTISKAAVGASSYDAVLCDPTSGNILPGFYNKIPNGWSIEGPVNSGDDCYETHHMNDANCSGIKNLVEKDNAKNTAQLSVTQSVNNVSGSKVITVTVKTSAHSYTVKVADENLK